MADALLLNTTLLAAKFPAAVEMPPQGRSNSAVVKTVVDMLKYMSPEILFSGDELYYVPDSKIDLNDTVIVKVHVIDAPFIIDFSKPQEEIVKWFLKQIRSNKKHIVLQNIMKGDGCQQTVIDIYMRGVFIKKSTTVKHLNYQPHSTLSYAV